MIVLTENEKKAAEAHFWSVMEDVKKRKLLPCGCCYEHPELEDEWEVIEQQEIDR